MNGLGVILVFISYLAVAGYSYMIGKEKGIDIGVDSTIDFFNKEMQHVYSDLQKADDFEQYVADQSREHEDN